MKIKLKDQLNRVVTFDPDAGATVGRNLRWPNGQVVTESELRNGGQSAGAAPGSGVTTGTPTLWRLIREIPANILALAELTGVGVVRRTGDSTFDTAATTDDLPEGASNLYFTDERAYETAKAQFIPGAGINITPNDLGRTITLSAPNSVATRTVATTTHGQTDVIMSKTQLLIDISCDVAARIRIYGTSANRAADASRSRGTEAPQGAGLLLEFITTGSFLGALLTPGIIAYNSDSIVLGTLYFNVEPDTSPTAAVVVGYLPLES